MGGCLNELLCHKEDSKDLVHTTETAGIDLTGVDGTRHKELLEHDTVLAHFTSGNTNAIWLECFPDSLVAEDIIWGCGLLNKPALHIQVNPPTLVVSQSTYQGLNSTNCFIYSIASGTLHTWFASTITTLP